MFDFDEQGCLVVLKKLNHENVERHTLTLRAFNPDGNPKQETTSSIVIKVLDVNEAPVFVR